MRPFLAAALFAGLTLSAGAAIPGSERDALLALHQSTSGPSWTDSTGWLGNVGTECSWFGVTCDSAGNHVTGIDLSSNGLSGSIPTALTSLASLEYLDLSFNDLAGPIPNLSALANLEHLDLSAVGLTGPIPTSLAQIPALEDLILGQPYDAGAQNNRLTGGIPAELSSIPELRNLSLGFNDLGGSIPSWIPQKTTLRVLDLSANELTGEIPAAIGQLTQLESLSLAFNQLTGSIPSTLGALSSLLELDLQVNGLSGTIPAQLGQLSSLEDLFLNENSLSGPIPSELGSLANLRQLYLHTNELNGPIPASFAMLTNLVSLQMFGNELSGPLPVWIDQLANLETLLLDGNRFTGAIPPQITSLTKLTGLGLGGNLLEGQIPANIGNLTEMQYLSLDSAGLTGDLPASFWQMTKLIDARLEDNDLTGSIPSSIAGMTELQILLLDVNRLSGPIPAAVGALPNLQILGLDGNRFSGPIPAELGQLDTLQFLGLEQNALRGEIPVQLMQLSSLQQVRLSFNALSTSNAAVLAFLNDRHDGDPIEQTQTVAPTGVSASEITDRSVVVSWTPILFTGEEGGYEIRATPAGGGSAIVSTTGSKRIESHIVRGLEPQTSYSITVRSTTHPFAFQQNFLRSDPTSAITITTTPRQTMPAEVALVSGPSGLIQIGGEPQNEDQYVLGNFGDAPTTVTLGRMEDHFTQEPESFVLEPGAMQTITLRSVSNQAPGSYWGYSTVAGEGVPEDLLVPVILLSTPPATGTAVGEALSSRVDVFGIEGSNGVGSVRFRNRGSATLQGVLVSDNAWIRTAAEPITIPPGEIRTATFDVLRVQRPRSRGAVTGSVRLVYVASAASKGGVDPRNGTAVSSTLVTVVDTVAPEARASGIPDLAPGEIRRIIPGVSRASRPMGTLVSDISITNAFGSSVVEDLEILLDRAGSEESSAATVGTLAPSTSLVLANIVQSVYGDAERTGTLHIRAADQQRILVEAAISNVSGPLGEMRGPLPVFRTDRSMGAGQSSYLMDLQPKERFETTIYVQEMRGAPATVTVEYRRASGELLEQSDVALSRFELKELRDLAPAETELIRAVAAESSEGAFVTYALQVDRETGSVSTIVDWTTVLGYAAGETVRIPIVLGGDGLSAVAASAIEIRAGGDRKRPVIRPVVPDAALRTTASIMNPGSMQSVIDLTYFESTGAVYRHRKTIAPGGMLTISDLSTTVRGRNGSSAGYVVAEMVEGSSIISAAVVRKSGGAELVSTVPVMSATNALRLGQEVSFQGLEDSTSQTVAARRSGTRRTGFGLTETSGAPVTVRLTASFAGKSSLVSSIVSKDLLIPARGTVLHEDLLRTILGPGRDAIGDAKNVQITLKVIDGDGSIGAFVFETDNASGDTRFMF